MISVRAHPRWSWLLVALLTSILLLPFLHYLSDHENTAGASESCPVCLLLNIGFLALLVACWTLAARRPVAVLSVAHARATRAPVSGLAAARAPPLSN
jgi:hypothetical protein